jgi:hypothetical protein
MSLRRFLATLRLDALHNLRRPLYWILILVLVFTAWGLSTGVMQISSGDTAVGGKKAFITSEFAVAEMFAFVVLLFYAFFLAVAAGLTVIQDDDLKVGEILHATRLRSGEYIWAKFAAVLVSFAWVMAFHLAATMFCNHLLPNANAKEVHGPFALANYLRPTCIIALPTILFFAGVSFLVGEYTRKPILVFVLPVAALLICAFFLWDWAPSWLDPRFNKLLMFVDPTGFRWLNETWLKVDRGVDFYNTARVGVDTLFAVNRIALCVAGLAAVFVAERHFARTLRGVRVRAAQAERAGARRRWPFRRARAASAPASADAVRPLVALAMRSRVPSLLAGIAEVARVELRQLRSQPGMYIFVPIILIQTIGTTLLAVGAMDTPLLLTPGTLAVAAMGTLTTLVCLLLLFYTVESLQRERGTGLAAIYYASPLRTAAMLFGKALANSLVGVVIVLACLVADVIALLVQHTVAFDIRPFAIVWGLLLFPTFLAWTAFVMALFAIIGNRYTTYGLALAALIFTGYKQATGKMTWVGNWPLWRSVHWSDLGVFETDRTALILNRIMILGLACFFVAIAVRFFPRREHDAVQTVHRLRPRVLGRGALRLLPYAVVPLVAGIALGMQVSHGIEGGAVKKLRKDYWRKNIYTWKDAHIPDVGSVALDVSLEPDRHWFHTAGSYMLVNRRDSTIAQIPLTGGDHWQKIHWTLNGRRYTPEDRKGLYVFTPPRPLALGDSVRIGFAYEGRFPKGATKNGGNTDEFILPSGVVLTSFSPSFAPVVGFIPDLGVDKDNRAEPRDYPADFYEGVTRSAFGSGAPFPTRIRITAPAAYTLNSVGTRVSEEVRNGRRTALWVSDHPVSFFNIVCGRWTVKRGNGTEIYYSSKHRYNIEEMSQILDAARRYYSEWFAPFPWRTLKLSEFPALAGYAQGFPTDITFSEGLGFLTRSDPKANAVFLVTAHESAHQWWGNMLVPGEGPGGDILSEGMAHFSTILLFDQVKGARDRMEFCKRIESRYGDRRQVDAERPLVRIDGSRPTDTTVMYDKGGWVFWMMLNVMGRDRALAGLQHFLATYRTNPDHPVLQDFVASMAPFAPDSAAYNDFVRQWFFQVAVPEYKLSDAHRARAAGAPANGDAWDVTVRVKNAGTARMPVEIAATRGERWPQANGVHQRAKAQRAVNGVPARSQHAAPGGAQQAPAYADARVTVVLGKGESKVVTIHCPFKPEKVVVDPDVRILQLNRKTAVASL